MHKYEAEKDGSFRIEQSSVSNGDSVDAVDINRISNIRDCIVELDSAIDALKKCNVEKIDMFKTRDQLWVSYNASKKLLRVCINQKVIDAFVNGKIIVLESYPTLAFIIEILQYCRDCNKKILGEEFKIYENRVRIMSNEIKTLLDLD